MNFRRGAFRLWVIASVLFVIGTSIASFGPVHDEFEFDDSLNYPTLCIPGQARGKLGIDYNEKDGICWYFAASFRKLFPEYNDLSKRALETQLYVKAGQSLPEFHPWRKLATMIAVGVGCPLGALFCGWGLFWAFAGFKQAPAPKPGG